MSVSTRHPDLTQAVLTAWAMCRDAEAGAGAIKAKGETYLPKPSGFNGHEDNGVRAYAAYQKRARVPEILAPAVGSLLGIAHGTEITVEMPDALKYLEEDADGNGMPLEGFHRRITRKLLVEGRAGVLADAPEAGGEPLLALYSAGSIINWDRDFFVLDESGLVRKGFDWDRVERYRVLTIEDGAYTQTIYEGEDRFDLTPAALGGKRLTEVPFTVASAKDLGPGIETPPLVGVAEAVVAIYQLSADYRHQLFLSGQETLLAVNGDPPQFVGAGVVHEMHGAEGITPDLRYVGPSCAGIDAHREAIEGERDAAAQAGARLFEQSGRAQESGEARALRFRSETANLQSVLQMSCAVLEGGLRHAAIMKGLDPAGVVVNAPANLLDAALSPQEAMALWRIVKERGLSYQTFFEAVQKGGIVSPERTSDDEYALIEARDFAEADGLEAGLTA